LSHLDNFVSGFAMTTAKMQTQEITVCAFIYNPQNQLLIGKRAAHLSFLPNKYELLGGHIEFGETLQKGLIRELKAEMGIDIIVENPFYAFTYLLKNNTRHTVEIDFFARMKDKNQQFIIDPNEHSDYKWVNENEIDTYFDQDDEEKKAIITGFEILKTKKY